MRYRRLRAQVKDLLCELCTSEAEVAATLRSAGVRAAPLDGQQCAVALYLKAVARVDGRIREISVGTRRFEAVVGPWKFLPDTVAVRLPTPVRQFVAAFDRWQYPDLVRDGIEKVKRGSGKASVPAP